MPSAGFQMPQTCTCSTPASYRWSPISYRLPSSANTPYQRTQCLLQHSHRLQSGNASLPRSVKHNVANVWQDQHHRLITASLQSTIAVDTQFLGLKGKESYLEPEIASAFDDLASTTVEEGYSPRVQDGKIRMLQQAAEELRSKSQQSADIGVHVEWNDLPGALALLQEVSQSIADMPFSQTYKVYFSRMCLTALSQTDQT